MRAAIPVTLVVVLVSCAPGTEQAGPASPQEHSPTMTVTAGAHPPSPGTGQTQPAGLAVAEADQGMDATFGAVIEALEANDAVTVLARVDHAINAASVGLRLPPTKLVVFGNPTLGTALMQASPATGIDLPQKILVWEDPDGEVRLAHNTPGYLAARHGLGDLPELDRMGRALGDLIGTQGRTDDGDGGVGEGEGLVTVRSSRSFDETVRTLESAIRSTGPLSLVATVDHRANAASAGEELRPTTLLMFGNPRIGTPLMRGARTVGIDLPQKLLVHEDADGIVRVTYNDPAYLAGRHGLVGVDEQTTAIGQALAGLVDQVTDGGGTPAG